MALSIGRITVGDAASRAAIVDGVRAVGTDAGGGVLGVRALRDGPREQAGRHHDERHSLHSPSLPVRGTRA